MSHWADFIFLLSRKYVVFLKLISVMTFLSLAVDRDSAEIDIECIKCIEKLNLLNLFLQDLLVVLVCNVPCIMHMY